MVRIQQDMELWKVLDVILADYSAVPPSDYKGQLRVQMRNEAMMTEAFTNAIEREIEDAFSRPPRIDEIEDWISEMPSNLAYVLDHYGIRETARRIANNNK